MCRKEEFKEHKYKDGDLTLRAATAAASFSSRAFSFCLRFFRRVSGTSIACNIQQGLINFSTTPTRSRLTEAVGTL
jgi:hypothetical protein